MGEIDVTKVTAIEYLEKLIEIDKNTNCYDYNDDCYECEYRSVSCASLQDIVEMGVENPIEKVMSFTIFERRYRPCDCRKELEKGVIFTSDEITES